MFSQLRPGGRFIFDDFLMTPALIDHMRRVQLRAEYTVRCRSGYAAVGHLSGERSVSVNQGGDLGRRSGRRRACWSRRRYRRLSLSWLEPAQARSLLVDAGFEVEACYGDFERTPFAPDTAHEQVWIARRPL